MGFLTEIGYRSVSTLARFLPSSLSYLIGETLAATFYLLSPGRRNAIAGNLEVILGGKQTGFSRIGFRVMLNFGRNVVDTLMLPHLDPSDLRDMVDIEGKERIDRVLASGRGLVLVTAHLGSWELGGAALAAMGYSITTVAGVQFSPALSPYIRRIKQNLGVNVVSSGTGLRRIMKALEEHGVVALHMDGDQFVGGIETSLFGRRVRLPAGPAALAVRTASPVLPAFSIRTGRRRINVVIGEEIDTGDRDEAAITRRITGVVEEYIRRYPDQWCIFRSLWEKEA